MTVCDLKEKKKGIIDNIYGNEKSQLFNQLGLKFVLCIVIRRCIWEDIKRADFDYLLILNQNTKSKY